MRDDAELRPWFEHAVGLVPELEIVDAHMHVGENDPDGFKATAPQILHALELAGARGVVFPFQEPDGYREANDRVIADAAASEGRLVAFCRLDPNTGDAAAVAAVLRLVPPGQVLFASDCPYGTPLQHALFVVRCALQAGLSDEQARGVMGAQASRLVNGEEPLDLGPALAARERPADILLQ